MLDTHDDDDDDDDQVSEGVDSVHQSDSPYQKFLHKRNCICSRGCIIVPFQPAYHGITYKIQKYYSVHCRPYCVCRISFTIRRVWRNKRKKSGRECYGII
jgi:hypothetical protein